MSTRIVGLRARPLLLYHFTCRDHGAPAIDAAGHLVPRRHPLLPGLGPLVWLTDLPDPPRDALGLTSDVLSCDRMAVRYEASTDIIPDLTWWPFLRDRGDAEVVRDLESYGSPLHWWVARGNVPIRRSP